MTIYLSYILASCLWCVGLFASALPDMILDGFSKYMDRWIIGKPIITCVTCMASVHVPVVMLIGHFLLGITISGWQQAIGLYLLTVPAVAFFNTILWIILTKISDSEFN